MLDKEQKLFSVIASLTFDKLKGLKKLDTSTFYTIARRAYQYLLGVAGTCNGKQHFIS